MKICSVLFLFLLITLHGKETALYLDDTVPVNQRVNDLLKRMTLEEKIGQMCQYVGIKHKLSDRYVTIKELRNGSNTTFYPNLSVDDLRERIHQSQIGSFLHVADIDEANFLQQQAEQSRLRIPLLMGTDASHGHGMFKGSTIFPTLIGLASSWHPELIEDIGRITAHEMRSTGYHWTFSVNLSIARDARWGRVGETFGEDPYLVGKLGAALTRGYQSTEFGENNIISCANYFIGSSTPLNGTNFAPMEVSERTLREVYLPPYKNCIDSGVYTVMAAHNDVNGIPCHASSFLFTALLRGELGFQGFVVSDWTDIDRLYSLHKVAASPKEACKLAILAGIDMNMHGPGFFENVLALVKDGEISEQRIENSVRKILLAKFQLGLFENRYTDPNGTEMLLDKESQQRALDAARESVVLLKNENLLPIQQSVRSIFLTGPNANNETILGDWTLDQPDENVITVLEGLRLVADKYNVEVDYFDCGQDIKKLDINLIEQAAEKVFGHDLAIVVVGENSLRYGGDLRTCGENADRDRLNLVGKQLQLIQQVEKSGIPVIVVLVNGRPLTLPWIYEKIPVLLEAWEPGMQGGLAIAEIIFGEVNPSGKLPITIPRSVGQNPSFYNHKPSQYFRPYAIGKTGPFYPFGFGLNYSTFEYKNLQISNTTGERTTVSIDVTNTSTRVGTEIVQLYIHDQIATVTRPVKDLKGFNRVTLNPGETASIKFDIHSELLSFINADMQRSVEHGFFDIMVGPNSVSLDTVRFEYVNKTNNTDL